MSYRKYGRRALGTAISAGVGYATRKAINYALSRRRGGRVSGQIRRLDRRITNVARNCRKEVKTHDKTASGSQGTSGTIIPLSFIAQGDTSLTREGLQINPKYMQFKLSLKKNANSGSIFRMIIFKDREKQSGATSTNPTATDLLESDDFLAYPEHDKRPRFKIYRDMLIALDGVQVSECVEKGMIKFSNKTRIWYGGTAADEQSAGKNALYMYLVSDDNTNQPSYEINTRLRFTD